MGQVVDLATGSVDKDSVVWCDICIHRHEEDREVGGHGGRRKKRSDEIPTIKSRIRIPDLSNPRPVPAAHFSAISFSVHSLLPNVADSM